MSAVTREQLVKILEEKLEQKLAPFQTTFNELKKSVEEAKELLSFTSKQYDPLLKRLTVCEEENKKLRNENKTLQKTLDKLDTSFRSVTKANNDLEQYTRRECVEIRGVPQKPEESNSIVKDLGKAIGVDITDTDISVSHHLPPSKFYKSKKPGPSPIIVKFVRRDTKGAFYRARLKLNEMTSNDLGFTDEHRMYISESLSPTNRELFNEAYKLKKDLDYKFLWTSNGKVFLRSTEVSPVIFINSLDLVKKIRNQNRRSGPPRPEAQGQNLQVGISD